MQVPSPQRWRFPLVPGCGVLREAGPGRAPWNTRSSAPDGPRTARPAHARPGILVWAPQSLAKARAHPIYHARSLWTVLGGGPRFLRRGAGNRDLALVSNTGHTVHGAATPTCLSPPPHPAPSLRGGLLSGPPPTPAHPSELLQGPPAPQVPPAELCELPTLFLEPLTCPSPQTHTL